MSKKLPPLTKVPHMLHGADYNPEQWLNYPGVFEEDIRMMKLAGCNVMSVGIFSWVTLEPEEGVFLFEWLDKVIDTLYENGIYVFLATPSGSRPAWLSHKYPEVLRTRMDRVQNLHGVRHNHNYHSPVFREKISIINRKLAERYSSHPGVLAWHVSNEFGGEDHSEYSQIRFREWLKQKYGTLEALNHAWWTTFWSHTYTDWEQIESPAPHGENQLHGMTLDWKRFVTASTVDYIQHEITPLREVNPDLPVTTNLMYNFKGLDYREIAKVIDIVSWDMYPAWHSQADDSEVGASFAWNHDLFRSLKQQAFLLMESTPSVTNWQYASKTKRPGMHRLSSLQAVAHGSDSVQYFQWRRSRGSSEKFHGAVVDHVGHEHTRVFRDVAGVGQALGQLSDVVGTVTEAKVGILYDWSNLWAINDAQGPRQGGIHFDQTVLQHYRAFWEQGVAVDIISPDDDFSKYALITAPMMYLISERTGQKLEDFVQKGGRLVTTYWSGIVNEYDLCHLGGFPGPLRKTLGIWVEDTEGLHDHDHIGMKMVDERWHKQGADSYTIHEICEYVHAETAEVLATYCDDFYAGSPALTCNKFGEGEAYHMAGRVQEREFYDAFYGRLVDELGIARAIKAGLPRGVTATVRTDGTSDFVFIMNFSGQPQTVMLDEADYTDMETGERVTQLLELSVNGCRIFRRAAQG